MARLKRVMMMDIDGDVFWGQQTDANTIVSQGEEWKRRGDSHWNWKSGDESRAVVRRPTGAMRRRVRNAGDRGGPPSGFIPCKAVKITRNKGKVEVRIRK